ncbi:tetratricopeptide repeat protein [Aeromonas veronii]|uniref:tetratricopeptide repeat protein n=1 Tax=Aeromonas veronii TaxID=654 RepID=UPI003D25EA05
MIVKIEIPELTEENSWPTPEENWQQNPEKVTSWIYYAENLADNGDIEKAHSVFIEAFASDAFDRKVKLSEHYALFVSKYLNYTDGEKIFEQLLSVKHSSEKTNYRIKDFYVNFLIKNERLDEAKQLLISQAEEAGTTKTMFKLAGIYEAKGDFKKSIPIYEELVRRSKTNSEAWRRLRDAEKSLQKNDQKDRIIKSISFAPEHHVAGLSILQNFGSVLNKKYPNGGVAFSIQQIGTKIIMTIEHPEGDKEIIEEYLTNYGLAVFEKITPEQYTCDPVEIMDLKRQIIQYKGELEWANEKKMMIEGIVSRQDSIIKRQETDLAYFKEKFGEVLHTNSQLAIQNKDYFTTLMNMVNNQDGNIQRLVNKLIVSAENKDVEKVEEFANKIFVQKPSVAAKIKDFIFVTATSASGNAPAWIDFLSKTLP